MENDQIYGCYIQNPSFTVANPFIYSPIIYFDPTQLLFSQNVPNFHLNIVHPCPEALPLKTSPPSVSKNNIISAYKCKTEVSSPYPPQKNSSQKREDELDPYFKVINRNILPNNLNLLLSYIRRVNKSGRMAEKIIERINEGKIYTVKKFYAYQAYVKQQIPFHKTKHTLRNITEYHDSNYRIFTFQQQKFYNKVCRILVSNFLRGSYLSTLLTSSKSHTSKSEHLRVRRFLLLKLADSCGDEMEAYRQIQN